MTRSIFGPASAERQRAARLAFAGNRIDRQTEHRAPDCLEPALADPRARAFALLPGRLVMADEGGPGVPMPVEALQPLAPDLVNAVLLGFEPDGAPRLALSVTADPEAMPAGFTAVPLRAVYAKGLLAGELLGLMAQGASLVTWNLTTQFCGRCGGAMAGEAGGYRRRCIKCDNLVFPRTDPVVIMLAIDETRDRCLLGRSPHFAPGMYSCLAGFLEPGETMEDAVRRETLEESGIRVGAVRYHASQPWPLPHTIMIGFYAEALTSEIDLDSRELEDCRWFSRDEAHRLLERRPDEKMTAPAGAIANLLLQDWVEASL